MQAQNGNESKNRWSGWRLKIEDWSDSTQVENQIGMIQINNRAKLVWSKNRANLD